MLKGISLILFLGSILIPGIFLLTNTPCFSEELTLTTLFTSAGGLWTDEGTYIYPDEAGDTVMVITDNGKVGIGTTSPVAKLDVAGSIYFDGGNGDANGDGSVDVSDSMFIAKYAKGKAGYNLNREGLARADVDGNGIVTEEDSIILAAMLMGYSRQNAERGTYNIAYRKGQGSLSATGWSDQRFIIDGNVGIGTTSPQAQLDIIGATASDIIRITSSTGSSGDSLTMSNDGKIRIGTTDAWGNTLLSVGGTAPYAGMGVYGQAQSNQGSGIYGETQLTNATSSGVWGEANATSGIIYGVKGSTSSPSGYGGYFTGGNGLYASRIEAGGSQAGATKKVFDIAEDINVSGCEAADVVIIDPEANRRVIKTNRSYDTRVAGVISENPVFRIGKTEGFKPLVLAGQIYCKATTENGPIKRGDLLTTSSKPGYAMKATFLDPNTANDFEELKSILAENEKRRGSIIGKALEPLKGGEGKIVALVTLQ